MSHIKMILKDDEKSIYSVRVTIARTERVNSGSMMFHHSRYYTFGQMVIFTDSPLDAEQGGALIFPKSEEENVLSDIKKYISYDKEKPTDSEIIEEIV